MSLGNGAFYLREWWQSLPRERRFTLVAFGGFCVAALAFSGMYISFNINRPFMVSKSSLDQARIYYEKQTEEDKAFQEMLTKDTDRDGLSDYAEQYVYRTSAYIPDTDSDGMPDPVEIALGTDPNCPQGKICHEILSEAAPSSTRQSASPTSSIGAILGHGSSTAAQVNMQAAISQQPPNPQTASASEVRKYLVSVGLVTQEKMDTLSDDLVMQMYIAAFQQALSAQGTVKTASSTNATKP